MGSTYRGYLFTSTNRKISSEFEYQHIYSLKLLYFDDDDDEFRTVWNADPSWIATEKDKRAGSDCLDRLTALFIFIYR